MTVSSARSVRALRRGGRRARGAARLRPESWPEGADLRVRIAVHTGEAQVRSEGSYLGHALNRCARIRATAHGGQVLVSATTAALVMERLPSGATSSTWACTASRISGVPSTFGK